MCVKRLDERWGQVRSGGVILSGDRDDRDENSARRRLGLSVVMLLATSAAALKAKLTEKTRWRPTKMVREFLHVIVVKK